MGFSALHLKCNGKRRLVFVQDLSASIRVHALTGTMAELAGFISGQEAGRGIVLPFADLLIGATALHLGYDAVTENVRQFEMIPGLTVKQL